MADETVIIKVEVDNSQAIEAAAKTKKAIDELKNKQKELNDARKKGAISDQDYFKQSTLIDASLKKQQESYSKLSNQISGTNSFTEKLKDSFGQNSAAANKLTGGLAGTASGLVDMTKQSIRFIATPLGAILAALAITVVALNAAIKTNDEVADEWSVTMRQANAVLELQKRNLGEVGTAIDKLIHLDFAGFWEQVDKANSAYNEDLKKTVELHGRLAEEQNKLDDATNQYNLTEQATRNEIAKLIIQSKDRTLTDQQRIDLNQKAADREQKLTEQQISLTKRRALIDLAAAGDTVKTYIKTGESLQQFGQRILNNSKLTGENQKIVVDAVRSIDEEESKSIALQEKLQNQRSLLMDAKAQKDLIDAGFQRSLRHTLTDDDLEQSKIRIAQVHEETDIKIASADKVFAKTADNITKTSKADKEKTDNAVKVAKLESTQKLLVLSTTLNQGLNLIDENTAEYKILASAKAIMDTYMAADYALSNPPGPPFSFITAAVTIATGLANVAKINGAFAGGGSFFTKGPQLIMVGDNPGGVEKVDVTPVSGKGQTTYDGNMIAMAGGGTVFSDGGLNTNMATAGINEQMLLSNMFKNMPDLYVSWTEGQNMGSRMAKKAKVTEA